MEFLIFHVGAFRSPGLSCRDGRSAACRSGKTVGASSLESPTQNWKPWDLDLDFMDFLRNLGDLPQRQRTMRMAGALARKA